VFTHLLMFFLLVGDFVFSFFMLIVTYLRLKAESRYYKWRMREVRRDVEAYPILLALSGKAGCGKSTIAHQLVTKYAFHKLSFADELKSLCLKYFPSIMAGKKEHYRKLLQGIGCYFRKWNPNVWVNIMLERISHLLIVDPSARIVIDDMRFKNEYYALEAIGFLLVRIERDPELRRKFGYNVMDTHISETDLDDMEFHLTILNNGKYPFKDAVKEILEAIGL